MGKYFSKNVQAHDLVYISLKDSKEIKKKKPHLKTRKSSQNITRS